MNTVLVLIDIQRDYFPGGRMPLDSPEPAARRAAALLAAFRDDQRPIAHVHHHAVRPDASFLAPGTVGVDPWPDVVPLDGEPVFIKHHPNAFRDTDLAAWLESQHATTLLVAGMMTHMCVDATVRAAADQGWQVGVAADACATRTLVWDGRDVPAASVHAAFLAALQGTYADVRSTEHWLGARG